MYFTNITDKNWCLKEVIYYEISNLDNIKHSKIISLLHNYDNSAGNATAQ